MSAPPAFDLRFLATFALPLVTGACKSPPAPPAERGAQQPTVQVAAASDLSVAFEELGRVFEARTGRRVTFSFAASGALAQQLSQGAPFDVFAAANASFVDRAIQAGACDGATKRLYARGHVVAWTRPGVPRLQALHDLASPRVERISIANPETAPYGKAAKEALQTAGLWAKVEHKIVQADNVRQALQLAQTGNVEVALVARSLVILDTAGAALPIDAALHRPIEQTLVVCRRGKNQDGGRDFAELVESSEGRALLARHGFGTSTEQGGE
jgi:molybdate transport system substrate-binding protein